MSAPVPATQATVKRHIEAARKAGLTVVGIRPDGTVLVTSGEKNLAEVLGIEQARQDADARRWGDG